MPWTVLLFGQDFQVWKVILFMADRSLSFATLHFIVLVAPTCPCAGECVSGSVSVLHVCSQLSHLFQSRAFGSWLPVFGLLCLGIIAVFISNIFNSFFNWLVHVEVVAFMYCKYTNTSANSAWHNYKSLALDLLYDCVKDPRNFN